MDSLGNMINTGHDKPNMELFCHSISGGVHLPAQNHNYYQCSDSRGSQNIAFE